MLPDLLAQQILRLIEEGGYQPGDRLPTIADLASRFEAARGTVREALVKLQTIGVLEVRHGSGIYVRRAGIADAENAGRGAGNLPGTVAPRGGRGEAGVGPSPGAVGGRQGLWAPGELHRSVRAG
jgi:DNA-binding transcriptional MocR family regulator